jgi:[NiFe] hydrogenase diaphorase moiety large subunit
MSVSCAPAVKEIVESFASDKGRLLNIVVTVQHRFGHVSDEAIKAMAASLGLHPVEVEEMVSFYAFSNRLMLGRNRIRLSKTPISFMKGAEGVAHAFEQALGMSIGGTSADGLFTLQWTDDIGMADQEPTALVNGVILTELTPADVPAILTALRQEGRRDQLARLIHGGDGVMWLIGPLVAGAGSRGAFFIAVFLGWGFELRWGWGAGRCV